MQHNVKIGDKFRFASGILSYTVTDTTATQIGTVTGYWLQVEDKSLKARWYTASEFHAMLDKGKLLRLYGTRVAERMADIEHCTQLLKEPTLKTYDPQVGDLVADLWDSQAPRLFILDVADNNAVMRRDVITGRVWPDSMAALASKLKEGQYRPATDKEKLSYYLTEADRLDSVVAQAIEDRARVMEKIAALRNASHEKVRKQLDKDQEHDMFMDSNLFVDGEGA